MGQKEVKHSQNSARFSQGLNLVRSVVRKSSGPISLISLVLSVLVHSGLAGCKKSDKAQSPSGPSPAAFPTKVVIVPGKLSPAPGLSATDYQVWGSADNSQAHEVTGDGSFASECSGWHMGFVFATPRAGSASKAMVGTENGLYMAPSFGTTRLVSKGSGYDVAQDGPMAVDVTTTIFSMLLMHPAIMHPSLDVSAQQMKWMVARYSSGWACIAAAAKAYEADLLLSADSSSDPAFAGPMATCLSDLADMPEFEPPVPTADQVEETQQALNVQVSIAQNGVVVSRLEQKAIDETSVRMAVSTRLGTALDYRFVIKEVASSENTAGLQSPIFANPDQLKLNPTTNTVLSGTIPASSYWAYFDLVGKVIKQVSSLVGSAINGAAGVSSTNEATMTMPKFHEVRLFSGGLGSGYGDPQYAFAIRNLKAEQTAAFLNNLTMAGVEAISVVPGVGDMLGNEAGQQMLVAAIQQGVIEVQQLVDASVGGTSVTGTAIYNAMYNVIKKAVDKYLQKALEASAGQGALAKAGEFVFAGGAKTLKFFVSVPSKVLKGGTAVNRAFRLAKPETVLEYYVVAVGVSAPDAGTNASDTATDAARDAMNDTGVDGFKPDALTCVANSVACGRVCCPSGQKCLDALTDKCGLCAPTQTECGGGCCEAGLQCTDPTLGRCGPGVDAGSDAKTNAPADAAVDIPSCPSGRYALLDPGTVVCNAHNGSGLVKDTSTGLTWMRQDYAPQAGQTQVQADAFCAGKGMRLPTKEEALGISGALMGNVNEVSWICAFPCRWYTWTSTLDSDFPDQAWYIGGTGSMDHYPATRTGNLYVLCVR